MRTNDPKEGLSGRAATGGEGLAATGRSTPPPPRGRLSSLELYRSGRVVLPDYDLGDPYELAVFRAVRDHVDAREEARIRSEIPPQDELDARGFPSEREPAPAPPRPSPAELERALLALLSYFKGISPPPEGDELFARAKTAAAMLFPGRYAGEPVIPKRFWEAGDSFERAVREGPREETGAAAEEVAGKHGELAPLSAVLRWAFGELVTQSEGARILDITDKALKDTLHSRNLPFVRVGFNVMISKEPVERAGRLRRQRQRRKLQPPDPTTKAGA